MKKVDLIYFDAGSGHRTTAQALVEIINEKNSSTALRLINIQDPEILGSLDMLYKMTGISGVEVYNLMLQRDWTVLDPFYLALSQLNIRIKYKEGVRLLVEYWQKNQPDLVVSLIPLFNGVLWESLQKSFPNTPLITVLTDLADCPPHYWIEKQKQYFICPTQKSFDQARAMGHHTEFIFRNSGLIINPRFYQEISADRCLERERLGLKPNLPTALIMFGGNGSNVMLKIAKVLDKLEGKLQLIFMCGSNKSLANSLRSRESKLPTFIKEFTHEIPFYMYLSDFFIGKPGNICISEAVQMNLPIIIKHDRTTLVQERYTSEWIVDNQIGVVLESWRNLDKAVNKFIEPENLLRYRNNTSSIRNQGLLETSQILLSFMNDHF
jgi:UDP-N-acetylglucosamine:LPS N-acetylglucosamine transferase